MRCDDACESFYGGNLYSNLLEAKGLGLDEKDGGLSETISAITYTNTEKAIPFNKMQAAGNPKIPTQFRKNGQD